MAFLATFPEVSTTAGGLHIRQDLIKHSLTVEFKDRDLWDVDTQQVFISPSLIHFVQPSGSIVGIKVFGGSCNEYPA